MSERPTVSELRKAHDAALTEWKTGGHGDRGYFKALDIAKILADRLEEAESYVIDQATLANEQRQRAEKAEREVERRHDITDCKAAWGRMLAVRGHARNCRCHGTLNKQCDEVTALQIDQSYPHLHPYIDPACAALQGGDRE